MPPDLGTGQPQLVLWVCVCVRGTPAAAESALVRRWTRQDRLRLLKTKTEHIVVSDTHLKRCSATLASGGAGSISLVGFF